MYYVDVDMVEAFGRSREVAKRRGNVAGDFGLLAVKTGTGPGMTIFAYTGPDVAFCDEFCCGSGAGVTEGVKVVEDLLSKGDRDEGSRSG